MDSTQTLGLWSFIYHKSKHQLWIGIILSLMLIYTLNQQGINTWDLFDKVSSVVTLAVVIIVWFKQIKDEWEKDHLPKRLTGYFYFEKKEIMRFENASLASEGDIRALAQQIGSQMVSYLAKKENVEFVPTRDLKFVAPEITVTGPEINNEEKSIHYDVSLTLIELPPGLKRDTTKIWHSPFMVNKELNILSVEGNAPQFL